MLPEILIVEDDADIAESLEYNFKREGFRPVIAESGEKGLRLALDEKHPPALIILDLMLPGMSGTGTLPTSAARTADGKNADYNADGKSRRN